MGSFQLLPILLIILLLARCNAYVDIPFEGETAEPVEEKERYNIVAAFSPDRATQWVYVNKFTTPGNGQLDGLQNVEQAVVEIKKSGNNDFQAFTYEVTDKEEVGEVVRTEKIGVHRLNKENFSLEAGEQYMLRVTIHDAVFTASCQVPEARVEIKIDAITYNIVENSFNPGNYDLFVTLDLYWQDLPGGQDNFYFIEGFYVTLNLWGVETGEISREKYPLESSQSLSRHRALNNYNLKGEKIRFSFQYKHAIFTLDREVTEDSKLEDVLPVFSPDPEDDQSFGLEGIEVYVSTTTKVLHDYQKSSESYRGEASPFNEPVIIPSNIERTSPSKRIGAQGVFGCYRMQRLLISREELIRLAVRDKSIVDSIGPG